MRPLIEHKERLRFHGESDEALLERLRTDNRGGPQKPDESEAQFLDRLVRNSYMRVYMRESEPGKRTQQKRRKVLREVRGTDDPRAESQRVRERRRYDARTILLNKLKSKPCMDCGGSFPPCAMQFDHRDPGKKDRTFPSVSAWIRSASQKRFEAEIAKCDLICANCHAIRTFITHKHVHHTKRAKYPKSLDRA